MKQKTSIIALTLIFSWGILLRIIEVVNGNYLFGFDQGRDYLAAYNIVVNHKLTLIGAEVGAGSAGLLGLFHGPGYYYLLALVYAIFRGDPYGSILLMFVFGVATLVVVYLTVGKMLGKSASYIVLFLVGICPLIVSQSRFLWNHHPSSFLIVLVLYCVYKIRESPKLYAPISVFLAGSIYHFELAIAVPLVVSVLLSLVIVYRIRSIKIYLYSIIAAFTSFLPFILFEARHGWMAVRSLFSYVGGNAPIGNDVPYLRLRDHMGYYMQNAINSFPRMNNFLPEIVFKTVIIFLFCATVYFALKDIKKERRKFFQFLLVMLVTSYGMFLLLNNIIWDYYLIHAHFAYMYVFSYCLINAVKSVKNSLFSKITVAVFSIFLISSVVSSCRWMIGNFRYDLTELGGVEKIRGKRMAIDYVYKDAQGKPFSVFVFMPPIYTYPYDYLFTTYGRQKYGYVPEKEKKGLVYLIIEKDNSKPWTYKGWLETVIVDGSIIDTTTLETGHIIQKRIFPL
jgi:hypothetical protein